MAKLSVVDDEIEAAVRAKRAGDELRVLRNEHADVIIRGAAEEEYMRFKDEIASPDTRGGAQRTLVIACVVWPEEKEFLSLLRKKPGLVDAFGNDCLELSGFKTVNDRKKL
jgi:hypothetical protein